MAHTVTGPRHLKVNYTLKVIFFTSFFSNKRNICEGGVELLLTESPPLPPPTQPIKQKNLN